MNSLSLAMQNSYKLQYRHVGGRGLCEEWEELEAVFLGSLEACIQRGAQELRDSGLDEGRARIGMEARIHHDGEKDVFLEIVRIEASKCKG